MHKKLSALKITVDLWNQTLNQLTLVVLLLYFPGGNVRKQILNVSSSSIFDSPMSLRISI